MNSEVLEKVIPGRYTSLVRHPENLDQEELARILFEIQRYLYLERDPYQGEYLWNAEKDLFPPEALEHIDEIMGKYGLHPAIGVGPPERFIHRPGERLEGRKPPRPRPPE